MKYKKLEKRLDALEVSLTSKCSGCGMRTKLAWEDLSTEHSGGCGGHGPEEYCYCSEDELTVSYKCAGCNKQVYIQFESSFTY